MSNTIQIKHGEGDPTGKLQPYELGYSDDGCLYIGTEENTAIKLSSPGVMGLINSNNYLKLPSVKSTTSNLGRILVCGSTGIVYYKTPANIRSEIGAFPSSGGTISGATTVDNTLTVSGATTVDNTLTAKTLVVGSGNWGTSAPTGTGVNGQLYFVLV